MASFNKLQDFVEQASKTLHSGPSLKQAIEATVFDHDVGEMLILSKDFAIHVLVPPMTTSTTIDAITLAIDKLLSPTVTVFVRRWPPDATLEMLDSLWTLGGQAAVEKVLFPEPRLSGMKTVKQEPW